MQITSRVPWLHHAKAQLSPVRRSPGPFLHLRYQSTVEKSGQFYGNRQLELYASKETKRLTLRQLVLIPLQLVSLNIYATPTDFLRTLFGRRTIDQGTSTFFGLWQIFDSSCKQSANYVRTELPVRIAHRLRDLQALPYVVVTQEGVARVYEVRPSFKPSNFMLFMDSDIFGLALLVRFRKVRSSFFLNLLPLNLLSDSETIPQSPTLPKMTLSVIS